MCGKNNFKHPEMTDPNMFSEQFFSNYFRELDTRVNEFEKSLFDRCMELIQKAHSAKKKLIFAGNGGSAAIASHLAVDFTKTAHIRAINFNEADLITCFANDFGYEDWVVEALKAYGDAGDVAILISSSGSSANIVNAATYAKASGILTITLSGFKATNPLRGAGDVNLWVNSELYNVVELTHQIWLLAILDCLVEQRG